MRERSPPFPSSRGAISRTGGVTNRRRRAALVFLPTSLLDATAFGAPASDSPKETRPVTILTISKLSGGVVPEFASVTWQELRSVAY